MNLSQEEDPVIPGEAPLAKCRNVVILWDLEKKRRIERHPSLKWQMARSSSEIDSLGFMHLG